ncbi:putative bifunctional diguanylate cyclase/phosphodiesterase [Ferrimonas gelatinilytica]|uniref:EAL domain-containing protein n=1 Tax=Ferrimonas gelatinilytica TaxID=1255257 RepID=A0ABP9RV53_9GAMM
MSTTRNDGQSLVRRRLPPLSLPLLIAVLLAGCLVSLVMLDFVQGRDQMREHLQEAQRYLLLQRARQMEQLLVSAGPRKAGEVVEMAMLHWTQEEELLAAAVIDREQRIFFGSRLVWRGGQAERLLDGYRSELARTAVLSGRHHFQPALQRGSLQLYFPLAQLKSDMAPRLIYLEQDLTPLNAVSQSLFLERLGRLWGFALALLLGLLWLGYYYLARPLEQLRQQALRLGEPRWQSLSGWQVGEIAKLSDTMEQANHRLRQGYVQLSDREQRWLYALEGIKAGVWDWQIGQDRVFFSHHWKAMLGFRDDELVGSFGAWEKRLHPEDSDRVLGALRTHLTGQGGLFENTHRLRHRDGHYIWVQDRAMVVDWDPQGRPSRMVGTHLDITDEMALRSRQFGNDVSLSRTGLVAQLTPMLQQPSEGEYALLAYLDLDDFKLVNDVYGHRNADQLLAQLLARLQQHYPQVALVRRLNGDEFALLFTGLDPHQEALVVQAQNLAEQLLDVCSRDWLLDGESLYMGTSIGLTLVQPGPEVNSDLVLGQAELALFQSKSRGRGGYCLFRSEMQQQVRRRLWLRDALGRALSEGELALHYQPVVDADGLIHGAEALLRWHHPQRGDIAPGQFLPVAHRYGLCHDLVELQLERACRDLAVLRRFGLDELMLNVSPRQLLWPPLASRLQHHLAQHGLTAKMLVLELSESELAQLTPELESVLVQLRGLGVRLALDNFGAGFVPLSRMPQIPFTRLKLDTRYVCGSGGLDGHPLLVAQMELAAATGLEWMAEGVDDEGCLEVLRQGGCPRYQGYLFGAPQPVDDLLALLKSHGRAAPGGRPAHLDAQ